MFKYILSVIVVLMLLPVAVTSASGVSCGGIVGDNVCGKAEYCAKDVGKCDAHQPGRCAAIPQICTMDFRPVCGCNEKTYSNACAAAAAGVNILHDGECKPQVMACGGIAGVQCSEGQYCNFGAHCGTGDQQGACMTIPEICTQDYVPVCGCDGKTYSNSCMAAAAGASVVSEGDCAANPKY